MITMYEYMKIDKKIEAKRKKEFYLLKKNFRVWMTLLRDTKEQNNYIRKQLNLYGIPYKKQSLKLGDFGFYINTIPEFNNDNLFIAIERKHDINELIGNFWDKRKDLNNDNRFERNLKKAIANKYNYSLLIENGTWENLFDGNYVVDNKKYNSMTEINAIKGKILSLRKFNIILEFIPQKILLPYIIDIILNQLRDIYIYADIENYLYDLVEELRNLYKNLKSSNLLKI